MRDINAKEGKKNSKLFKVKDNVGIRTNFKYP